MIKATRDHMRGPSSILIDASRCLRHRYYKSRCHSCVSACMSKAVFLGGHLGIDESKCTGCMLCVSACPTDALSIESYSFAHIKDALRKADAPVLACSAQEGLAAHATGPCLGHLSREHMTALTLSLGKALTLNMSRCNQCDNAHIVKTLASRASIIISGQLRLALDENMLSYKDVEPDRREFFRAFRNETVHSLNNIYAATSNADKGTHNYGQKSLPLKRRLLNSVYKTCPAEIKTSLANEFYKKIYLTEKCSHCFSCVAMCPTGALSRGIDDLDFNSFKCCDCGLCVEFCPEQAIAITPVNEQESQTLEACVRVTDPF